jgi:hypothetical protein
LLFAAEFLTMGQDKLLLPTRVLYVTQGRIPTVSLPPTISMERVNGTINTPSAPIAVITLQVSRFKKYN